jgi:putative FmdB family regulatory protein
MPTYEYECTSCERRFEVEQRFTDDPLTTCTECAGTLRKVYSAVGVVFKGSGFYKNDSRPSRSSESQASSESKASSDAKGSTDTKESKDSKESSTSTPASSTESSKPAPASTPAPAATSAD